MRILVTGATGMLGTEVVPRLVANGHTVFTLSRGVDKKVISSTHIQGDVTQRYLGGVYIPDLDAVLHLAALTSLRDSKQPLLKQVNVLGTCNVVELCKMLKVPKFFYCSTLYVAGDWGGIFTENDLFLGQSFKNTYEETKFQAENFVRECSGLDTTILRPGILVGHHSSGYSKFFEGFYRPVRAIIAAHRFAEKTLRLPPRESLFEDKLSLPPLRIPIRIYGDPGSTLALTPVDWAADVIAKCVEKPQSQTYHIVPSVLPTLKEIVEGVNRGIGVGGLNVSMAHTRNPLDVFYNKIISEFRPYLSNQPTFQTSVGDTCPPVDVDYVQRIIAYWRENGRAKEEVSLARA